MNRSFSFGLGGVLLVLWLALWGHVTVINVASGILVVAVVLLLIPETGRGVTFPTVRPVWAVRFAVQLLWSLIRANVEVAREVASPGSKVHTGIIAVPMTGCSDGLITLVANVLGMAPGTVPVEVTRNPSVIYVHVLHLDDPEATRAEITHLTEVAVRAFGSAEAVEALP